MTSQLIHFLASPRVSSYKTFLKLHSPEEVYRAYCWNYAISAAVFPLLGSVEMHLRDSVNKAMSGWRASPGSGSTSNPTWYDPASSNHYPLTGQAATSIKGLLEHSKTRKRLNPQPPVDDVIASLTFGFWTTLIRAYTPVEAPSILPKIFPNHPIKNPKFWGSQANRTALGAKLRVANDFRNRIAHHEPLFKFRYNNKYPTKPAIGLSNLRACVAECLEISEWVDAGGVLALKTSIWHKNFESLANTDALYSWVKIGVPFDGEGIRSLDVGYAQRMSHMTL